MEHSNETYAVDLRFSVSGPQLAIRELRRALASEAHIRVHEPRCDDNTVIFTVTVVPGWLDEAEMYAGLETALKEHDRLSSLMKPQPQFTIEKRMALGVGSEAGGFVLQDWMMGELAERSIDLHVFFYPSRETQA